jgi:hypothetical protein
MKSKHNSSLWLGLGALGLIACSATCIGLLENRRVRAQSARRYWEDPTRNNPSDGGAILSDKSHVTAPVL